MTVRAGATHCPPPMLSKAWDVIKLRDMTKLPGLGSRVELRPSGRPSDPAAGWALAMEKTECPGCNWVESFAGMGMLSLIAPSPHARMSHFR